jgi:uncharacterized protein
MIEWDETKRAANFAIHGVNFPPAAEFEWVGALVVENTRFDYGETRYQVLGIIGQRHNAIEWGSNAPTRTIGMTGYRAVTGAVSARQLAPVAMRMIFAYRAWFLRLMLSELIQDKYRLQGCVQQPRPRWVCSARAGA